jgi:hypothetical protein
LVGSGTTTFICAALPLPSAVAAVMVALIVWLVWHRYAFDKPITQEAFRISPRKREEKVA